MSAQLSATRTRLVWTLFGAVALGRIAFIMAVTVATLVAQDITTSAAWAGFPPAIATLGTAGGATVFTRLSERMGRTNGFTVGYGAAALGAGLTAASVQLESFALLLVGMFTIGLGHSVSHLARYAAADLRRADRRAAAISFIVWAGTVGSVVGPLILEPLGTMAESIGMSDLAGPYLGAMVVYVAAALVFIVALRPEPMTVAVTDAEDTDIDAIPARPLRELFRLDSVRYAIVALVIGQVVMVGIMTVTPLHIRNAGLGLGSVGVVITAHTLGMFAFAPVTGWLVDRLGTVRVISAGAVVLLAASFGAAVADGGDTTLLVGALWALGYGWNMTFVGGSTHLIRGLNLAERLHIQGVVDTGVWTSSAGAAALSGVVVATTSYGVAGAAGAVLSLLPVIAWVSLRSRVAVAT